MKTFSCSLSKVTVENTVIIILCYVISFYSVTSNHTGYTLRVEATLCTWTYHSVRGQSAGVGPGVSMLVIYSIIQTHSLQQLSIFPRPKTEVFGKLANELLTFLMPVSGRNWIWQKRFKGCESIICMTQGYGSSNKPIETIHPNIQSIPEQFSFFLS